MRSESERRSDYRIMGTKRAAGRNFSDVIATVAKSEVLAEQLCAMDESIHLTLNGAAYERKTLAGLSSVLGGACLRGGCGIGSGHGIDWESGMRVDIL